MSAVVDPPSFSVSILLLVGPSLRGSDYRLQELARPRSQDSQSSNEGHEAIELLPVPQQQNTPNVCLPACALHSAPVDSR